MGSDKIRSIGLFLGPVCLLLTLILTPPAGLTSDAWYVTGVGMLMAIWWMTEALPIPATSLIPLVLFPVLGVADISDTAAPYANPLIYLFLAGFLIAEAVQQSGLHRRLALFILSRRGDTPKAVVAGFMAGTALLSMWMSNTATVLMMLPIGISVIQLTKDAFEGDGSAVGRFGTLLMLSIAYAASVGGVGTLIGTPTNIFMAGFLETSYGISIGFAAWMMVGIPVVALGLPIVYFVLTRVVFPPEFRSIPGGTLLFGEAYHQLGKLSKREFRVSLVFYSVAALWMTRPLIMGFIPGLSDAGIAMTGAVLLFVIPAGEQGGRRLLSWAQAAKIPWGVLILFGGGLSLASQIGNSGLSTWIGQSLAGLSSIPVIVLILLFTSTIIFLTELTSNTATAAAFLPIVGSFSVVLTGEPLAFVIPATIAASCAFMLPVATPPNAIVYGSDYVDMSDMVRAGIYLNFIFIALITLLSLVLPISLLR